MKYINRELKGTFGYIRKQTCFEIVKTVILFAMALGIFFIGYITLGTRKSLWSVFAVLALLPACKSLVGVIMLARFRSLSDDDHRKYSDAAGNIPALYENILTTSDRTFYVPVICYGTGSLVAYMDGTAGDIQTVKKHLEDTLKTGGHGNITVKVYERSDKFLERLEQMLQKQESGITGAEPVFNTIRAVSL